MMWNVEKAGTKTLTSGMQQGFSRHLPTGEGALPPAMPSIQEPLFKSEAHGKKAKLNNIERGLGAITFFVEQK
jgi:hypothetical protein